jgi:hypothetical protein
MVARLINHDYHRNRSSAGDILSPRLKPLRKTSEMGSATVIKDWVESGKVR